MFKRFPMGLYRAGGDVLVDGLLFSVLIVQGEADHKLALADGWHETASAALAAAEPADDAPPTREELEAKATELGVKFDGRWGDKRLSDAIAAKLKG